MTIDRFLASIADEPTALEQIEGALSFGHIAVPLSAEERLLLERARDRLLMERKQKA